MTFLSDNDCVPPIRRSLFHFLLTLAEFSVMDRNDSAAFQAGIFLSLLFHKYFQTMLTDSFTVCHETCLIPLFIAFFKIFYLFTWIFGTFKAIRQSFDFDTILYFALTAMFWFSLITI